MLGTTLILSSPGYIRDLAGQAAAHQMNAVGNHRIMVTGYDLDLKFSNHIFPKPVGISRVPRFERRLEK